MNNAWHLPWSADRVPHGVLDINRGCNIICRACYNEAAPHNKTLDEIRDELDIMIKLRRIDSLALAGGEVMLHPQLPEIVKMIKQRGITVEIFTNGLLLDDAMSMKLSAAGADLIFLHIEPSQQRTDLPDSSSFEDCRKLIEQKTRLICSYGMETGVVFTACDELELPQFADLVVSIPGITYLLVTLCRNNSQIDWVEGDIIAGMSGQIGSGKVSSEVPCIASVVKWFQKNYRLRPFARVGSNLDKMDTRWLSFLTGVVNLPDGKKYYASCHTGLIEKIYLQIYYCFKRRYPFYTHQNALQFRMQLLLNAFSGGCLFGNLKLLTYSLRRKAKLRALRILLQQPAEVIDNGTVVHCRNCPDATVKNGRLVPLCLADKVREVEK
ncbi:MAG: radical SAM protein [Victivallales bacterium]|nr:radical SAM protein [Victivallales bacterium]